MTIAICFDIPVVFTPIHCKNNYLDSINGANRVSVVQYIPCLHNTVVQHNPVESLVLDRKIINNKNITLSTETFDLVREPFPFVKLTRCARIEDCCCNAEGLNNPLVS